MAALARPLTRPLTLATMLFLAIFALVTPGCDDAASAKTLSVPISGKKFLLEVADTFDVRFRGLGGRTEIASDGGMLFLFPDSQVQVQAFVMRDCPIPIDIIYLDSRGRVLTTYTMAAQPRKADGSEGKDGDNDTNDPKFREYEKRLIQYSSKFPAQFVIELKGHTLDTLKVSPGDQIVMDWDALRKRAR